MPSTSHCHFGINTCLALPLSPVLTLFSPGSLHEVQQPNLPTLAATVASRRDNQIRIHNLSQINNRLWLFNSYPPFSPDERQKSKLVNKRRTGAFCPLKPHTVTELFCGCPGRTSHLEQTLAPQVFQVTRNSCSRVALPPSSVPDECIPCRRSDLSWKNFSRR